MRIGYGAAGARDHVILALDLLRPLWALVHCRGLERVSLYNMDVATGRAKRWVFEELSGGTALPAHVRTSLDAKVDSLSNECWRIKREGKAATMATGLSS